MIFFFKAVAEDIQLFLYFKNMIWIIQKTIILTSVVVPYISYSKNGGRAKTAADFNAFVPPFSF